MGKISLVESIPMVLEPPCVVHHSAPQCIYSCEDREGGGGGILTQTVGDPHKIRCVSTNAMVDARSSLVAHAVLLPRVPVCPANSCVSGQSTLYVLQLLTSGCHRCPLQPMTRALATRERVVEGWQHDNPLILTFDPSKCSCRQHHHLQVLDEPMDALQRLQVSNPDRHTA